MESLPPRFHHLHRTGQVRAQHEDILIVSLHEVAFAGYLAEAFRSPCAFPSGCGCRLSYCVHVLFYLRTQRSYLNLVLDMLADTIVVN